MHNKVPFATSTPAGSEGGVIQIPQTAVAVDALRERHPILYCPTSYGGCGEVLIPCAQRVHEDRLNYFRHKSESSCAGGVSAAHYFIVQQVAQHLQSLGHVTEDESRLAEYGIADLALLGAAGEQVATVEVQVSGLNGQVLDYRDKLYRESVQTVCWLFGKDLRSLADEHAERRGVALQVSVDGDGVELWAVAPDPRPYRASIESNKFRLEACGWDMEQGLTHPEIDRVRTRRKLLEAEEADRIKREEERRRLLEAASARQRRLEAEVAARRAAEREVRLRKVQEAARKRLEEENRKALAAEIREKYEARQEARARKAEERTAVREACMERPEKKRASRASGRAAAKVLARERERISEKTWAAAVDEGGLVEEWGAETLEDIAQSRPFGIRTHLGAERDLGLLLVEKPVTARKVGKCTKTGRGIFEVAGNPKVSLLLKGWHAQAPQVLIRAPVGPGVEVLKLRPGRFPVPKTAALHTIPLAGGGKRAVLRLFESSRLRTSGDEGAE